jgi:hypothetical protein
LPRGRADDPSVWRTCCGLFLRQETHSRVIDPADRQ